MNPIKTTIKLKKFSELTLEELYAILALRQVVFVVEQNAAYLDADGVDLISDHVLIFQGVKLAACSRIFNDKDVIKIGRVVVDPAFRRLGLGKAVMNESVRVLKERGTRDPIVIHAQYRLLKFYQDLGFKEQGEIFFEDGIEHKIMKYVGDG